MAPRPGGWWLHPNEGSRAPNVHIIIDCEAYRNATESGEHHTFRLACSRVVHRARSADSWVHDPTQRHETSDALWRHVATYRGNHKRVIVVAHNLAYDLRVADGLAALTQSGWTPKPPLIDRNRVLFKWTKGERSLVMVDSFNWLPTNLDDIGARMGLAKLPLPPDDADNDVWYARCERDVEILCDAWMRTVNFVADNDLGVWRTTGAGQAMGAFRHRFMTHRLLVHDDKEAREQERLAAWAGRAEAWKHGELTDGPFAEWDYELGYAHIMRECEVPIIYRGRADHPGRRKGWHNWTGRALLMRCTVETDTPCVPAYHEGGILWPVGKFETTLWNHEAALVLEAGGKVDIHDAWLYLTAPALRAFAEWCIGYLSRPQPHGDPVCQLAVKHFTRSIVGKFGTRYRDWDLVGTQEQDRLRLWSVVDDSDPEAGNILELGHNIFQQGPYVESQQSIPQVLSWVQSEMRVRLWRAMQVGGPENVCYVDTDGLIVNQEGHRALTVARIPHLRVKRQWEHLEIMGPRQLVLDGNLRAAGIPKRGEWADDGRWNAESWEQFPTSLRRGEAGSVRVRPRAYRLSGSERRRVFLPDKLTASRTLPTP